MRHWYIWYMHLIRYLIHEYFLLMGQQVTFHYHHINHQEKAWYLKAILRQSTTHPIQYQTYQLTRIHIQVCQILLCQIHLTRHPTSILNKDNAQNIYKSKCQGKRVSITLSIIVQIWQPIYLHLLSNQRPQGSNLTRIHYSDGFISYLSWIYLKLFCHHLSKPTCWLWNIYP